MKLLKELCETPGISGREQPVIDIMLRELGKAGLRANIDPLGNVIGYKKSAKKDAKKVLIAGHMDEIGLVVTHIDANGFIYFSYRGTHKPRVLLAQRVKIFGKKTLVGVVEAYPLNLLKPEDRKRVPELEELFIDTGLKKADLDGVIAVGDVMVLDRDFVEQGDLCIAKAFDDRVGCYIVLEAMKRLKDTALAVDVYAVGTSQEEVGVRGAYSAAKDIVPDFGIALDVTGSMETPGARDHQKGAQLGAGVSIQISDAGSISNHGMVEFLKSLAETHKIPHQVSVSTFGGTDAQALQRNGKGPVCTLSVPTRYIHSPNEILHKKDIEATIALLVRFLQECEACQLEF